MYALICGCYLTKPSNGGSNIALRDDLLDILSRPRILDNIHYFQLLDIAAEVAQIPGAAQLYHTPKGHIIQGIPILAHAKLHELALAILANKEGLLDADYPTVRIYSLYWQAIRAIRAYKANLSYTSHLLDSLIQTAQSPSYHIAKVENHDQLCTFTWCKSS